MWRPQPLLLPLLLALQVAGGARADAPSLDPFRLPQDVLLRQLIAEAESHADIQANMRVKRQWDETAVQPLDTLIDFMLAGAVPQIISHGKSALPIPDFSLRIDTSLGKIFKIAGSLAASGGSVQDVKSLFRQGPAVLRRAPSGLLLLDAAAGIRLLRLSYANYTATVNGLSARGQVEVEVSPAAARAQLALVPPCSVQLRGLQLAQLGAARVRVTGLPAALSALPQLLEELLQSAPARQEVSALVLGRVASLVAQELKRLSCK